MLRPLAQLVTEYLEEDCAMAADSSATAELVQWYDVAAEALLDLGVQAPPSLSDYKPP